MRSWSGSSDLPLRGPASGHNLERDDDPEQTENHVSLFFFFWWTFIEMLHVKKIYNKFIPFVLFLLLPLHSKEDSEERSDH